MVHASFTLDTVMLDNVTGIQTNHFDLGTIKSQKSIFLFRYIDIFTQGIGTMAYIIHMHFSTKHYTSAHHVCNIKITDKVKG